LQKSIFDITFGERAVLDTKRDFVFKKYSPKIGIASPGNWMFLFKEEERLNYFSSYGYFIKEGRTKEVIKVFQEQYKHDFSDIYDGKTYTSIIPRWYIEYDNRKYFIRKLEREGLIRGSESISLKEIKDSYDIIKGFFPKKVSTISVMLAAWIREETISSLLR